ncbi:MAG: hypothetical protein DWQ04_15905 [Chloroflexi bacterium]|nr:MAG: hypothetical protein DWQ04_15905 [Chloroflexota bacterium]
MDINLKDIRQRWNKAKLTKTAAFWVAVGAILLTMYLGFAQAGWVTGGTALQLAERTSEEAVVARLAPICVAQFDQSLERDQKLAELKEVNTSSQRTTFVKDQGWATMPGETAPDDKVARECADQINLIGE